jgi:hypothetical protein
MGLGGLGRKQGGLMNGVEATVAIAILAFFLGGIVFGVLVIVSMASKREDRRRSLSGAAPDLAAQAARTLLRVGRRGDRVWVR